MDFPLQDACAGGGGFSLRNVPRGLQGNGKRRVGQRVAGGERGEGKRCGDGLLQPSGVAESADEAVVGFKQRRVGGNGSAKGLCGFSRGAGGEQIDSALGEGFCVVGAGMGHGSL